ncbi:hypothetical protein ACQ4PT_011150 [Festuca glaucescens]
MATAQVQQVMEAPAHDDTCVKEQEKNHEIIQHTPCAEVEEPASHAKGGCTDDDGKDEEIHATDTDEGERIAQQVEAKLAIQQGPAEAEAKDNKQGRLGRGEKKTEKATARGAIVPVDDDTDDEVAAPEGVKKTEKAAVVPIDDKTDDEVVAPADDQAPAAASVAPEEAVEAACEEVTKNGKEDACEEKAHED